MYEQLGISSEVYDFGKEIEASLKERFEQFDETAEYNQLKVLLAMQKNKVSAECFQSSSGYGYDDFGRDTLEKVYADTFHTEACLIRSQITCGTHALAIALFGNLRPGDELLAPAGKPYDTLEEVIGIRPSRGSLAEYGVTYKQVDLKEDGTFDYDAIRTAINEKTQSCGNSAFQRISDKTFLFCKADRRTDRFCKGHQTGCHLYGGQLLR